MNKVGNHIFFWIAYLTFIWITDSILIGPVYLLDFVIFVTIHHIFIFYSSIFVISKFSTKNIKNASISVSILLLDIALFLGLKLIYRLYIIKWLNVPPYGKHFDFIRFLTDASLWFIQYFLLALGYFYARRLLKKEADLRRSQEEKYKLKQRTWLLEQDNLRKEQAKLQAEYALLRSQINPHFLHNTLNFFYSKALHCSSELANGILTLSEIMRYSLNVGDENGSTAPLYREIEHLKNVITINQLRFNYGLNIDFIVNGNTGGIQIIPFVLITLVENAFKHGELTDKDYPLRIELTLKEDSKTIFFLTHNRKKKGPKELSHGIGIDNIRKRLQWTYRNDFTLLIKEDEEFYKTELTIRIQDKVMPGSTIQNNTLIITANNT